MSASLFGGEGECGEEWTRGDGTVMRCIAPLGHAGIHGPWEPVAPDALPPDPMPSFDGETYLPEFDYARLGTQMRLVAAFMGDGRWRALHEISAATGAPEASCSARLRDLRKPKFGAHTVDRRHRGPVENGLYEYRLTRKEGPCEN